MIIVSNEAERNLLDQLTGGWSSADLRLFKNNITPAAGTVIADFTEADFGGYAAATPTWGAAATDADGNAYSVSSAVTFTSTSGGAQTVYGWYFTAAGGALLFAERFAAPISISNATPPITFAALFRLRQAA